MLPAVGGKYIPKESYLDLVGTCMKVYGNLSLFTQANSHSYPLLSVFIFPNVGYSLKQVTSYVSDLESVRSYTPFIFASHGQGC